MRSFVCLLAAFAACVATAAEITASGAWYEAVDAADLAAGAGSDLRSAFTSAAGATTLSVNAAGAWQVRVRRDATAWPAGATLWVRRASTGSGTGSVEGGDTFVEVGATETALFAGSEPRSDLAIQFRVTGLTCNVPSGSYSSLITFSVH